MSKYDFELAEFQDRQARVRAAMESAGIDLLLVLHPVNINYLIGSRAKSYQELQVLFFTLEPGPLTILTRLAEVAEISDLSLVEDVRGWGGREPEDPMEAVASILKEKGYSNRRIGLEVPDYYLFSHNYLKFKDILGDSLVMEANHLIEELKFVKSPAELAYIRKAASISDEAMKTCVESVAEGKMELEIAGEIHRTLMTLGSDSPASPMNFASGERTAYGHGMPSERRIQNGDLIHLEYGAAYKRYCVTIGRVLFLGQPTQRVREIYGVVREASDAAIAAIKSGVPATAPHEAAKKVIGEAGLERYRLHLTGYGIAPGFPPMWIESVMLDGGNPYTLEAGMVVSIEPPVLIHEEKIGARVIDNVLVTETGAEILSKFTRDLILV